MKPILSIETSTPVVSVALHESGKLVTAIEHYLPKSHGCVLADIVKAILSLQLGQMKELVAVAVGMGPGSYTGLRIGASLAKGLCLAKNLPLIGIRSDANTKGYAKQMGETAFNKFLQRDFVDIALFEPLY